MYLLIHTVCTHTYIKHLQSIPTYNKYTFLGRMCCPKAFCDFGDKKSGLFQNHHWGGDGWDSHILTYSPAVNTLFSISLNQVFKKQKSIIRCNGSLSLYFIYRPSKVKDLPDSVCPVFLDKMEAANLSSLPLRSPCRLALTQRALLCLVNSIHTKGDIQVTN